MRQLGAVLLDLKAARQEHSDIERRLADGGPLGGPDGGRVGSGRDDDETRKALEDRLGLLDSKISGFENEARVTIEADTGVAFEHIQDANL